MAISSLTKFTVPTADGATQGMLMPKMAYRFRVTFVGFGIDATTTELTKQVSTFSRPNPKFDPVTIDVYNSKINLIGKPTWEDVKCTLRDDAQGNVSKLVGQQIQKQFDFAEQSSAASGGDYKFTTILEILDGGNGANAATTLDQWEMYGCLLTGVTYGEMSYKENSIVEIGIDIKFDNAMQVAPGVGIGTSVGRTLGSSAI
jgi:hypothetical protein